MIEYKSEIKSIKYFINIFIIIKLKIKIYFWKRFRQTIQRLILISVTLARGINFNENSKNLGRDCYSYLRNEDYLDTRKNNLLTKETILR